MISDPLTDGVAAFSFTFLLGLALTAGIRRVALARGWTAAPSPDRWHSTPTPLFGGVGIYLAFVLPVLALGLLHTSQLRFLLLPATGMFLLGLWDDVLSLRPRSKLLIQVFLATLLVVADFRLALTGVPSLDLALTLLWLVGITNAFNLLDNMNGLCAGIALLVALFRAALFVVEGNPNGAVLCLAFAGAVLGFLCFNFPAGHIFMGDAGSLFLGFWMAAATLTGASPFTKNYAALLLFPLIALTVPILDTTMVSVMRKLKKRPISVGGKDHLSHRLVAYGFSETAAVLVLWALSFLTGAIAFVMVVYGVNRVVSIVTLLLLAVVVFGVYLTRYEVGTATEGHREEPGLLGLIQAYGALLAAFFDLLLAMVAYYTAYLVRFEGRIEPADYDVFFHSFAELALIKLAVFLLLGVYRQWWPYFGVHEALRLSMASGLASAVAFGYFSFMYRLVGFSRGVLVLDFLLFLLLVLVFRVSFRLFDTLAPVGKLRRIAILGATPAGELALQIIAWQRRYAPVGFLDSDPAKRHLRIHSVPVLGAPGELEQLASEWRLEAVAVTTRNNHQEKEMVADICRRLGLALLSVHLEIEELQPTAEVTASPRLSFSR